MDKPTKKEKLIETVPRKKGYLSKEEATKRLPVGRPKGAKNKSTIFKEVMRDGFEERMLEDGMVVIDSVIQAASGKIVVSETGKTIRGEDGKPIREKADMQAAKMLLDRFLPTTKAIDLDQLENSKGLTISINVGELTGHPDLEDKDIIDGD